MDPLLLAAIEEAELGPSEGGIPIGSVLALMRDFVQNHPSLWAEDIGE